MKTTEKPLRSKHYRTGISYQDMAKWEDMALSMIEAIRYDDNASHTIYQLDWRHRLAFAYRMLNDPIKMEKTYREAATLDPHLLNWINFYKANKDHCEPGLLIKLWQLIDGKCKDQQDAIGLMESVQKHTLHFPEKWWFNAYNQLYRKGWAKAAYMAKSIAADTLRKTFNHLDPAFKGPFLDYAAAFADIQDLEAAKSSILRFIETDPHLKIEGTDFLYGLLLLEKQKDEAASIWKNLIRDFPHLHDPSYQKLIQGKRIAVVAPGNTGVENGEEIDGFDLVVRTNFRSHQTIRSQHKLLGSRTDICYFNGNFEPANRDEIVATLKQEPIRYAVLRFHDQQALEIYQQILPTRVSHIFNAFYKMNTYAIPKIIVDLTRYAPAEIKIFNADFYLRNNKHYEGYYSYDIDLVLSFLGHDVLRNFKLVRDLHRAGVTQADQVLTEVLQMSEEQVIDRAGEILAKIPKIR